MKFSTGKRAAPIWVHLYGPEGIGKSTFAADAPDPVFLDVEQGTDNLATSRVTFDEAGERTRPTSFAEVMTALGSLARDPHPFKTIVLDTADALEALIWAQVCAQAQVKTIEDFGYGKGYVIALSPWRQFVDAVETLRAKGYNVITLGHALIKPFKNPEGEDFDRYIPKLHEKASALIKERANAVLFANWRNATRKDSQTKRVRGVTDKARLIYTTRTAAYDAKNRYDLPEEMPLSWVSFYSAVQAHKPADPTALRAAILEKIERLPAEGREAAAGYLAAAGTDAVKLSKLNGWINAQIPESETAPAAAETTPAVTAPVAPAVTTPAVSAVPEQRTPAAEPLTPGVDVPAMAKPTAPVSPAVDPKADLHKEILDAADRCKTAIDLAKYVLPLIKKAIDGKRFSESELAEVRQWYTDTAAALTKGVVTP
jgi:hypothetical protein